MNSPRIPRVPKRYVKKLTKPYALKGLLLYFLPLASIPATILSFSRGHFTGILVNGSACAAFLLAAWLLKEGIAAESQYQAKKIAHPPRWPLKLMASSVVAVSTGLVAWLGAGYGFWVSITFGLGALLGMFLTYGFDPWREKLKAGSHGYSALEISQTLNDAENLLDRIKQANLQIANDEFNQRIDRICLLGREILEVIEDDPGDIRRARKFLNVYLEGAQQVTEGYAKTHQRNESVDLEQNFKNVLETIESVFTEQKQKLIEDDVFDLDVQIEVLTNQLKREGVI